MLERVYLYNMLKQNADNFDQILTSCNTNKDYIAIYKILKVVQEHVDDIVADPSTVELHNQIALQLFKRAHKRIAFIVKDKNYDKVNKENLINDFKKIGVIYNDHATMILNLTNTQLKYHDTLMGIARKAGESVRVALIDKELESIK